MSDILNNNNNKNDTRLLELQGMFPGIEAGVVQAVWEAHGGQGAGEGEAWERAVEDLLQLSDPEYKVSIYEAMSDETTARGGADRF